MSEYLDLDDIDFTLYNDGELEVNIYKWDAITSEFLTKEDVDKLVAFLLENKK
jgi:hypothetical protein